MCTVSMIGDHYGDKWRKQWPDTFPNTNPIPNLMPFPQITRTEFDPQITRTEFDALKADVLEMKELLKRALEYDRKNGQPECQQEEKIALLKRVAEAVGIDLSEVFGKPSA